METARVRWRSEPEELGTTGSLASVSVLPSMLEKQEATTGWRPSLVGSGGHRYPRRSMGLPYMSTLGWCQGGQWGGSPIPVPWSIWVLDGTSNKGWCFVVLSCSFGRTETRTAHLISLDSRDDLRQLRSLCGKRVWVCPSEPVGQPGLIAILDLVEPARSLAPSSSTGQW